MLPVRLSGHELSFPDLVQQDIESMVWQVPKSADFCAREQALCYLYWKITDCK